MSCPPGKVLNPRTLRCVSIAGKTAKGLVQHGEIAEYYLPAHPFYARAARKTVRKPTLATPTACPPGQERNPLTGRCIKIGRKTYKRLHGLVAVPPPPPPPPLPPSPPPIARPLPPKEVARRTDSNGPIKLPLGTAKAAPILDKPALLGWIREQCKNDNDPLTGHVFAAAEASALQDVIRLHDRTCIMSGPLNTRVTAEHKTGKLGTIPGTSEHMTLDDFKALRDSMRRHNPAYKLPARRHQPPPANWQLYIGSDNRSGAEFVSVLYIDTTKVVQGVAGPEYPVESVRMDLGFLPINITGGLCAPQMVVDLLQRLSAANRLLAPVAGGWKPVAGFPFTKKYWSAPDAKNRLSHLCTELTKALTTPL